MKLIRRPIPSFILGVALAAGVSLSPSAGVLFGTDSYHECLLDELANAEDDQAAVIANYACLQAHPDMRPPVKKSSFLFGPDSSAECVEQKARDHRSGIAATLITEACFVVYPQPDSGAEQ